MSLVTYLECSLTGERYEAGQVHNLSRAGKPLLVRYDLDAARRTLTRESLETREPGMKPTERRTASSSSTRCTTRSSSSLMPPRSPEPG